MTIDRYYRPELDALRFFAFLSVFTVHRMDHVPTNPAQSYWFYNICLLGNFGVPVFFLLSAFLITELLFRESDAMGTIHLKAFYIRRILRIWPLYFLIFIGLAVLGQFVRYAGPLDPVSWVAFTFFAGNWYICSHGWIQAFPVNPLWSVSVEEQFYIVIPIIALYGRRLGVKTISLILLVIAYISVTLYGLHPFKDFSSQWTNSFVQFQFFSAGTLLSLYLKGRAPQWSIVMRVLGIAGAIVCLLVASIKLGVKADTPNSTALQAPFGWTLVLLGTVLLFLSFLGAPSQYLPRPVLYLGKISYGLYLFHELCYFLIFHVWKLQLTSLSQLLHVAAWRNGLGTLIAFCATVLVASLSYRIYERPFLRLKKHFTFVPSRD